MSLFKQDFVDVEEGSTLSAGERDPVFRVEDCPSFMTGILVVPEGTSCRRSSCGCSPGSHVHLVADLDHRLTVSRPVVLGDLIDPDMASGT